MKKIMNWLKNEESGQGMVEYGLILAFISIIAIVAIKGIGTKLGNIFSNANTQLS